MEKLCKNCCINKAIKYSKYSSGNFCSKKCAKSFSTKYEEKNKKVSNCIKCGIEILVDKRTSQSLCEKCRIHNKKQFKKIYKKSSNIIQDSKNKKILYCKYCGEEFCKNINICKKYRIIPTLVKYFGFNSNCIGSERFYQEYERIKTNLYIDYYDDLLSISDLMEKYNYVSKNDRNFTKIMNSLDIKRRNFSESVKNLILNGKRINFKNSNIFKNDWHITWNNKKVFYRSSYELEYCLELDKQKIDYEMEKIKLIYWDSQLCENRITIPDFYIPTKNEIIEIKSMWTYNKQNILDKFKTYKECGYNYKLILEHTEYNENNLPENAINNIYEKKYLKT